MADDAFKLGNFSNLPSDKPMEEDVVPEAAAETGKQIVRSGTAESVSAAKFSSPLSGEPLLEIPIDEIVPNEFQPRRIFNTEKLEELANSIKANGIIQPLVVVRKTDNKYELIVGERRLRASRIAGLEKVPAFIVREITNQTKLEIALIENVQRADLNPIEEAKAYERLMNEFGMTVGKIGEKVGKNYSTISNLLRLLRLPAEIQRALVEEKITEGQARPLLSLRDSEEMLAMFRIVMKSQMKARDVEQKVRDIKKRGVKVAEMFRPDPFLSSLENMLRSKFGTRVEVSRGAKGGKITIEFFSDEELNDIVGKIS